IGPVQLDLRALDRLYAAPPKRRIYIINNGKVTPEFDEVKPTAISIASRSIWTLTKSQHHADIYRIWRQAEDAGADFNLTAVPASFSMKPKQAFDPAYQRALFKTGYDLGRAHTPWQTTPPEQRATPAR